MRWERPPQARWSAATRPRGPTWIGPSSSNWRSLSPRWDNPTTAARGRPSLLELARDQSSRVINDLAQLPQPCAEHTYWLLSRGYRSSYTVPLFQSSRLLGFLFFDSRTPDAFVGRVPEELQIYVQLCRMSVLNVINLSHAVEGMVRVARGLAHLREQAVVEVAPGRRQRQHQLRGQHAEHRECLAVDKVGEQQQVDIEEEIGGERDGDPGQCETPPAADSPRPRAATASAIAPCARCHRGTGEWSRTGSG